MSLDTANLDQLPQEPNTFTSYVLTDEQQLESVNFSTLQRAFLQNLLTVAATRKVNLKVDPADLQGYIQREAELASEITLLRYLLGIKEALGLQTS